jgi:hypothetical protein
MQGLSYYRRLIFLRLPNPLDFLGEGSVSLRWSSGTKSREPTQSAIFHFALMRGLISVLPIISCRYRAPSLRSGSQIRTQFRFVFLRVIRGPLPLCSFVSFVVKLFPQPSPRNSRHPNTVQQFRACRSGGSIRRSALPARVFRWRLSDVPTPQRRHSH